MLTKNSLFDYNYFRYTLKRILPYSLVMLLVLLLSSFLVFAFDTYIGTLTIAEIRYIGVEMLGVTANTGMYVIPIVLSVGMFGFLHKKAHTDFILASPTRRISIYFTNTVAAFVIIAVTLALNLLFIAFILGVSGNNAPYVALNDYFISYFYNLAGYMLVFAVSSLAAVLTGTALSQTYMTFIILFLPTFIVSFLQLPFLWQAKFTFIEVQYTIPVNSLLLIPDITTMPISMVLLSAGGSEYSNFYGIHYFFNAQSICFTLLAAAVYTVIGILIFKKYRAENAGKSFVNKPVGIFAYAGSFGPVMLLCFLAFAQEGYTDMIDSPLFYIFIVLSFVSFIIASLIFNRGFSGFGKQLSLYCILIVSTAIVSGVLNTASENNIKTFNFGTEDVKSISVYMKPINAQPINETYAKQNYVKVKVDDPEILSLLKGGTSTGDRYYYEVSSSGKKLTLYSCLPEEFIRAFYRYIDENADVKETLIFLPGADDIACTALNIETDSGFITYSSSFSQRDEAVRIITERELEYLEIPIETLYDYGSYNRSYSNQYYIHYEKPLNYGLIDCDTVKFSLSALRNYNGQYYISNYVIDYNSAFFYGFAKESHERAESVIPQIKSDSYVCIAGAFDLDKEQYLLLEEIIPSMPSVMPDDFIAAVKQTIKEPIQTENTVGVIIITERETAIVFMDIERDIKPLLEIYSDRVNEALKNRPEHRGNTYYATSEYYYNGDYYERNGSAIAVGALYCKEISETTGFFDEAAFKVSNEGLIELFTENRDYINRFLTTKVTEDTVEEEYYFVSVTFDFDGVYGEVIPAVIPITKEMLLKITDKFDYLEKDASRFDSDNIEKVESGLYAKEITEKKDIDYLTYLLKDSFFRKTASEMYDDYDGYYYYSKYFNAGEEKIQSLLKVNFRFTDGTDEMTDILFTERASVIFEESEDGE